MNLTTAPAANAPSNDQAVEAAAKRCDATPRAEPSCARDAGSREAFERVLQAKRMPLGSDEEGTEPEGAQPEAVSPMAPWMSAPLVRAADTAPAVAAGVVEIATGTRAAIETALHHSAPHDPSPIGAERASVWEASVGGVGGSVELRAERIVAQGAPPTWGLTISAPALSADAAARHVPRLHDRLRKHGIDVDHVRIERDRDDSGG